MNIAWEKVQGLIRHALTFGGGIAVAKGWIDTSNLEAVVGALVTIIGAFWSFRQKDKLAG
jgi:hypothetical protein